MWLDKSQMAIEVDRLNDIRIGKLLEEQQKGRGKR
jgi:hypothetical protein